jgi:galactokinase
VIDSGLRRSLTESAFNQRRAECEAVAAHFGVKALRDLDPEVLAAAQSSLDPTLYARARHVVGEIARVEPVAVALAQGDSAALSVQMREAHRSLSVDFEVSLPPIDQLAALVGDVLGVGGGVRLTGAGFGGCLVAVSVREATSAIEDAIARYNTTANLSARTEVFRPVGGAAPITVG